MTAAQQSFKQSELDQLTDAQMACLRQTTQALATATQRVTQRYQQQTARLDSELCRRAATGRKAA